MKKNTLTIYKKIINTTALLLMMWSMMVLSSCNDDDPKKEDVPELITKVALTFTPSDGSSAIVVTANDPDGTGVRDLEIDGSINLASNKTYTLTIQLINGLALPTDDEYNITAEVEEEGDEHMFFFAWTNNVFANPTGNGNVDNRSDVINYQDVDAKGLPLGLTTTWSTIPNTGTGTFRVVLKHQPELKSASSTATTGETDLDISFDVNIQ